MLVFKLKPDLGQRRSLLNTFENKFQNVFSYDWNFNSFLFNSIVCLTDLKKQTRFFCKSVFGKMG